MSLSIGIVGLPNVGKSTLFNALLKRQAALAANYPFATIEPNVGIVDVPDDRLEKLAEFVRNDFGNKQGDRDLPEKITPAIVKFYDIAGLVKGAASGEGLGNEFLGHIRDTDAIIQVVRDFEDDNIIRAGSTDPKSDIEIINTELILADLQSLEKRLDKIGRDLKGDKSKDSLRKSELYQIIIGCLNQGKPVRDLRLEKDDLFLIKDLNLLTLKPMIYVYNVDEEKMKSNYTHSPNNPENTSLHICAKLEAELASFDEKERKLYMGDLGIAQTGLDLIIKKGFDILGLETYLTMGPKEVRAWTITKGTKAPQGAGVIHTDFERGFISAEVINYQTLLPVGSLKKAKDLGLVRLEGKDYIMKDGDIVEFRFSV